MSEWPSGIRYRPIERWPGVLTARRDFSPFSTSRSKILAELETEIRMHGAREVVLQVALRESQLRIDGMPKANVTPDHPGVILSFVTSEEGAVSIPCDTFTDWMDNLLAIVRTLNKLRIIKGYGTAKHSEQYRGWQAIEAATPSGFSSIEEARAFLKKIAGFEDVAVWDAAAIRAAKRYSHPDSGGDAATFQRVMDAEKYLHESGAL